MCGVTVRAYRQSDAEPTAKLFFRSVRFATADYYNELQRQAWAKKVPELTVWHQRLTDQTAYVADRSSAVVGFMTMNDTGYLDLAFVAPEVVGRGVGKSLYCAIEQTARNRNLERLTTEASLMARPFFERLGWTVIRAQTIIRHNVELTNFKMEKTLLATI